MQSRAATVAEYLKSLPEDRRAAIEAVRKVILKNLPKGYEEGMQYGMIGYFVPHSLYPAGYHCDPSQPLCYAGLASQKNHLSLYLMSVYADADDKERFTAAWTATGKKLDMGKSCIRFKKLEDVPLEVVGAEIRRVPVRAYLEWYEAHRPGGAKSGAKKKVAKKAASKKVGAKKKVVKTSASKKNGKKSTRRAASGK